MNRVQDVLFGALSLAVLCCPAVLFGQTLYSPFAFTTMRDMGTSGVPLFVLSPYGLCVDRNTNIYIACYNDYTIRKISTTNGTNWTITVFAGSPNADGSNDDVGTAARFLYPDSVVADSHGNLFVSDQQNYTIRKITPDGTVTTFAGKAREHGYVDDVGSAARFYGLSGMGIDAADNIYVSDYGNNKLRKITPGAVVSTIASGAPLVAEWGGGLCVDTNGNIYHASSTLHTIRKISPGGGVTTIAGLQGSPGSADGTNSVARFYAPNGIVIDRAGNLYVSEGGNSTIRKMTPVGNDWMVKTAAGVPGVTGTADGSGSSARFKNPIGIAIDENGRLYVADTQNALIRTGIYDGPTNDFNIWTNSTHGKWENPTNNWSTGFSPSIKDTINLITNAGSKAVLIDATTVSTSPNSLKINNLLVMAPDGNINGLALFNSGLASPLQLTENLVIDSGGVVAVTNGAIRTGIGFTVGYKNGGGLLRILAGGRVTSPVGYVGLDDYGANAVQISGAGSMWTNQSEFVVGYYSDGNGVLVENGGNISDQTGVVGQGGYGNYVVIAGAGSAWRNAGTLKIGDQGAHGNALTVGNGAAVYVSGETLIGSGGDSNVVTVIDAGSLLSCAGPLRLNQGGASIYNALYIGAGATVTTPSLSVSNGNFVGLAAGTLNTGSTIINNGIVFPVGVGAESATLRLNGGTHTFANGLEITDHGLLTGCGAINGPVTIDPGGTVVIDCGTLTFNGPVTNYGTILPANGTNVAFPIFVVNYGSILTNSGTALPPACPIITTGAVVNLNDSATTTITDGTNLVQLSWSLASPGNSGYIYTTANTAIAAVTNVTSVSQITNATVYTFLNSGNVGPLKDAGANGGNAQFVLLRNKTTGHYCAVRMDDVTVANKLNASWWFQSQSGRTNFGCVPPLPPAGPSPPSNVVMQTSSGNLTLSFATQPGRAYTVQMRTNLGGGPWMSVTNLPGDGTTRGISISPGALPRAYYRVQAQ